MKTATDGIAGSDTTVERHETSDSGATAIRQLLHPARRDQPLPPGILSTTDGNT
jgi:hypothetical protein